jgi:hypothetical protein
MKTSIWDILTGVVLLGILCMVAGFGMILINPNLPINPFQPQPNTQPTIPSIVLPSPTITSPALPPTWTPKAQAQETKVEGAATLRPKSTPVPTDTVVVLPTFTPSKTPRTGITGGKCTVVTQDPKDNSFITKGTSFTTHWTIKNSTSDVWRADSVDIRFISGNRLHSGNDVMDMPYDVGAGGLLDLTISMVAPSEAGSYVSNWQLAAGNTSLCNFFITFSVR